MLSTLKLTINGKVKKEACPQIHNMSHDLKEAIVNQLYETVTKLV